MESVGVDASTGGIGVVSVIKLARPSLNRNSVLRSVRAALVNYTGEGISKSNLRKRRTAVVSIAACEYILDNMSGDDWTTWRNDRGSDFKKSLRDHVERLRASFESRKQRQQQRQQQEQQHQPSPKPVVDTESKSSVLTRALRTVNITGSVRIDESTDKASIIDVIRMLCPEASTPNAAHMFTRVLEKERGDDVPAQRLSSIADRVTYIKINGKGHETPVSDAKTIVEIIWLLPANAAKEFRKQSAQTICRVLGGDMSICDEIEQRCSRLQSTEEGRAYQNFVLDQGPAKKHRSEQPFWFEHVTDEEKKAYASTEAQKSIVVARKTMALEEIEIYKACKDQLRSVNQFGHRDEIEFTDRIKDVQRRASRSSNMLTASPTEDATISVARPIDDSIDPETGFLIATPKCSESVRGPETSICLEAGKLGIKVGEKAGQVGKVTKRLYSERYGVEAGRNIPKRDTIFRNKPFPENVYWARDADLIQEAIRIVCTPQPTPRHRTTQTLLFATTG
ncbi:unnamed protein product [Pylaiella littoralis]